MHVPGRSYIVGGAVRDRLLGLPVSDRDHVVVGATVDAMKAAGFRPVGRDFPVFLHPETHEEYALARTERKVAAGYAGFVFHADPSVTLVEDLARRDLTINAIAEDDDGGLVDPFGGRRDLDARIFRHVGPAFVEDPVRVLRLARFAARFVDFTIAPETLALARSMADAGEIDALVPERVWQELSRGLMEAAPVRLFGVLRDTHALSRLLPRFVATDDERWRRTAAGLARAAAAGASLERRFAIAMNAFGGAEPIPAIEAWCERFAVPRAARELAVLVGREGRALHAAAREPAVVVALAERADAFRRRTRFLEMVAAVGDLLPDDADRIAFERRIAAILEALDAIDTAGVVASAATPAGIPALLRRAREEAIAELK